MIIAKELPIGKQDSNTCIATSSLGVGNIVPHWWYKEIRATGDKPDLVAITILSELYFLYRKNNGAEFNDGYTYFERKFDFTRSQLKDAIIRLDNKGLAYRSFRTIVVNGRNFPNELHLKINLHRLLQLKTKYVSTNYMRTSDNNSSKGNSSNNEDEDIFATQVCRNSVSTSVEISSEHISIKEIPFRKNRSMDSASIESTNQSNFINNNSVNASKGAEGKKALELSSCTTKTKTPWKQNKKKQLADFYPLSEDDCSILQRNSGREFSLNATNEILLDMSKRLKDKGFYSKQSFLNYMAKCLSYEMRDAVKINNTNFRIRANQSKEEREATTQEKYLNKLEYSLQVSPEWHFKKKLAAVFERSKAYHLLTSYKQLIIEQNGECRLVLDKSVNLTAHEQEIILSQLQASHSGTEGGAQINKLNIITSRTTARSTFSSSSNQNKLKEVGADSDKPNIETPELPKNIWGAIRSALIKHYGQDGVGLDNHWFSKLNASIDTNNRNITLKAPTNFIKDWVQSQYSCLIDKICHAHNYSLCEVV